eukprot:2768856-Amphidinium_carterae.1
MPWSRQSLSRVRANQRSCLLCVARGWVYMLDPLTLTTQLVVNGWSGPLQMGELWLPTAIRSRALAKKLTVMGQKEAKARADMIIAAIGSWI